MENKNSHIHLSIHINYNVTWNQINSCKNKYCACITNADRAADMHRETMKKKRREIEQASLDAASDLMDTDSNATFAMVSAYLCI